MQELLQEASKRGFIHQCTDLEALKQKKSITFYAGFDATASSLHIGSLVPIMLIRMLQKHGHKPIILIGGGTTRVGDPSGKDKSRTLLTEEIIQQNMKGIQKSLESFITFGDGPQDAIIVNNDEWLRPLNYIDFLRDVGRHFSVNKMMKAESVKLRLEREQPLSFLEFNYMLLQAYDFLELYQRHQCTLQIGGSDQWGNIVSGIDLTRRIAQQEVYGLTVPLLTTSSGAKMGKTADGAVWLNEDHLAPYDYYQYWRNVEDADVGRFLRLFTDLTEAEIQKLETLQGAEINDAKKVLAFECTKLCHGLKNAEEASQTAQKTFESQGFGDNLPSITISSQELEQGLGILTALHKTGLVQSNSDGRRCVMANSVKINDTPITDPKMIITQETFQGKDTLKLSSSKKKHALIKLG